MKTISVQNYQESQRALFRKLFSMENERFKYSLTSLLSKVVPNNAKVDFGTMFSMLFNNIYNGIYDGSIRGLDQNRLSQVKNLAGNYPLVDMMSALELKLISEALYNISNHIFEVTENGEYFNIESLCSKAYEISKNISKDMATCISTYKCFYVDLPNKSVRPIIKHFDKNLKAKLLPEDMSLKNNISPETLQNMAKPISILKKSYNSFLEELNKTDYSEFQKKKLTSLMFQNFYGAFSASYVCLQKQAIDKYKYLLNKNASNQAKIAEFKSKIISEKYNNKVTDEYINSKVIDPVWHLNAYGPEAFRYISKTDTILLNVLFSQCTRAIADSDNYSDCCQQVCASAKDMRNYCLHIGYCPELTEGFYRTIREVIISKQKAKEYEDNVIQQCLSKDLSGESV